VCVVFSIPYAYDYINKLHREQTESFQNRQNVKLLQLDKDKLYVGYTIGLNLAAVRASTV
jgi:hypothetical protein